MELLNYTREDGKVLGAMFNSSWLNAMGFERQTPVCNRTANDPIYKNMAGSAVEKAVEAAVGDKASELCFIGGGSNLNKALEAVRNVRCIIQEHGSPDIQAALNLDGHDGEEITLTCAGRSYIYGTENIEEIVRALLESETNGIDELDFLAPNGTEGKFEVSHTWLWNKCVDLFADDESVAYAVCAIEQMGEDMAYEILLDALGEREASKLRFPEPYEAWNMESTGEILEHLVLKRYS